VCEGIVAEDDVPMLLKLKDVDERDPFGNLQLSGRSTLGDALSDAVKAHLKITRVRCDTFGYLQRSFLGVISAVDASEARDVGETAVHFAVHGKKNGSVAIRRTGDYSVDYFLTSLESVAANTKPLPKQYLKGLNDIDESFKNYARPLMGPLSQFYGARAMGATVDIDHGAALTIGALVINNAGAIVNLPAIAGENLITSTAGAQSGNLTITAGTLNANGRISPPRPAG
jgi:hypothetical protein